MKAPITALTQEELEMYKDAANFSVWFNGEKQFVFGAVFTEKSFLRKPESNTVRGRMQNFFDKKVTTIKKDENILAKDVLFVVDENDGSVVQTWRFV